MMLGLPAAVNSWAIPDHTRGGKRRTSSAPKVCTLCVFTLSPIVPPLLLFRGPGYGNLLPTEQLHGLRPFRETFGRLRERQRQLVREFRAHRLHGSAAASCRPSSRGQSAFCSSVPTHRDAYAQAPR